MQLKRPTCKCGSLMIIKDTAGGLASFFYWACPKSHWWNSSEHEEVGIGTMLPTELREFYR